MRPSSLIFWSRTALVAMWLVGLAQLAVLAPHLPERVASHFDLAGRVDGWSSRSSFVVVFALLETVLAAVFLGVGELVLRAAPTWINLPHKERWLAPEREAETRATLLRDVAFIGLTTMLLILFAVHQCYLVSTELEPTASPLGPVLAAYVGVVGAWVVLLWWRYRRGPSSQR